MMLFAAHQVGGLLYVQPGCFKYGRGNPVKEGYTTGQPQEVGLEQCVVR